MPFRTTRNSILAVIMATLVVGLCAGGTVVRANYLASGDFLSYSWCVYSSSGAYSLCYKSFPVDCCSRTGVVWSNGAGCITPWESLNDGHCSTGIGSHANQSGTAGTDGKLIMQSDGNFVLQNGSGVGIWSTQTSGYGSSAFVNIQDDGNLVVYYNTNVAIWATY
jgi:hypothetical protein